VVAREFHAPAPNRVWVTDMTYIWTSEGWLFLAAIADVFSRRVVGWAMADHLRTELPLEALGMALGMRQPERGLVHHSDRGCQYASELYRAELSARGIVCSMSRVGGRSSIHTGVTRPSVTSVRWTSKGNTLPQLWQHSGPVYGTGSTLVMSWHTVAPPYSGGALMKAQRILIVLTMINLAVLAATLAAMRPAVAGSVTSVLRGRSLEIVDDRGRVRASLSVLPAGTSAKGDRYPETVLLRLITEQGRPSVKISSSEEASGVSLAGPSDTRDTYAILEARGTSSSLRVRSEDGREQFVKP
jgi:hypothetical protein